MPASRALSDSTGLTSGSRVLSAVTRL